MCDTELDMSVTLCRMSSAAPIWTISISWQVEKQTGRHSSNTTEMNVHTCENYSVELCQSELAGPLAQVALFAQYINAIDLKQSGHDTHQYCIRTEFTARPSETQTTNASKVENRHEIKLTVLLS